MAIYKYQVLTKTGSKKQGAIFADNYRCAYDVLCARQYHPLEIKKIHFVSQKITIEDLLIFFMHINFQLKCGVGINEAIDSFAEFHENKVLNATLVDVSNSLKRGESISDAFEKCHFDSTIVGLLKSAEDTGKTSEVISNILSFLKLQTDWKNKVKRAIAYPLFIAVIAVVVMILSIGVLAPQVAALIQTLDNREVPALTKFMVNVLPQASEFINVFFLMLILTLLSFLVTEKGRRFFLDMLARIPRIGDLVIAAALWQFYRILYIALDARLDFIQAMNLAIKTIQFKSVRNELENIRDRIIDGHKISESFSEGKVITPDILMAICIGEEGNSLGSSFKHVSDNQYLEMIFNIKSLGQILSVGLTIFTGLIFVLILCGLFYPIYNYIELVET